MFNLVSDGDFVLGTCFRKIQTFGIQGTVNTEKKRINVLLKVKNFDYQTDNDCIRVNGVNARASRYMGLGQHQAMDVHAPMTVTLIKKVFDSEHVRRLNAAASEA